MDPKDLLDLEVSLVLLDKMEAPVRRDHLVLVDHLVNQDLEGKLDPRGHQDLVESVVRPANQAVLAHLDNLDQEEKQDQQVQLDPQDPEEKAGNKVLLAPEERQDPQDHLVRYHIII